MVLGGRAVGVGARIAEGIELEGEGLLGHGRVNLQIIMLLTTII